MIKFSIPVNGEGKNLYFVNHPLNSEQSGLFRADSSDGFDELAQVAQIGTFELTQNDLRELIQTTQNALNEKNEAISRSRRVLYIKPGTHGNGLETEKKRITKKELERQIEAQKDKIIANLEKQIAELKAKLNYES